jgi:N-acetylmuramoyl-L-alanine amidase
VQKFLPAAIDISDGGIRGMSVPLLRETRMPAVLVELGPASVVVERGRLLATALATSVEAWAQSLWE